MRAPWTAAAISLLLMGCTTPLNNDPKSVVVDYGRVVTGNFSDILPPPKLSDLDLGVGSEYLRPIELQLERLTQYREYLDRTVESLQVKLNKDRAARQSAREDLQGQVFDCKRPLHQQIDLGKRPSATGAISGLSETEIASAALDFAEEMRRYNDEALTKMSEAATLFSKHCK